MYIEKINGPEDVKKLNIEEMTALAEEMRHALLKRASIHGGHFGPNFGMVEAIIALHYVFESPKDKMVFDVSHQTYPHKMLTGRKDAYLYEEHYDDVTGYSCPQESEHDHFTVGHTSTSVSLACGLAKARDLRGESANVIAIIGDGSLSGGEALEGMDFAAELDSNMIIVVNDNDMSISCSTGGFAKHLAALWERGESVNISEDGDAFVQPYPEWAYNSRLHSAATDAADNLFKAVGFDYFGPFDGHDVNQLAQVFDALKKRSGPRLIHIYTKKGKGFVPAEADQIKYHAISKLNAPAVANTAPKYSDVFGQWLCDEAAQDERLIAITPAMCEGSGMVKFAQQYPERYFDVAIAEQHAVTLAAGMACEGLKPVVAIYSTFLQRGYDQLVHDVALQNLDVTFGIDRAGLVGEDGPTHAGAYDYAYMRTIPNMVIMAPKDENECRQMLHTAYLHNGPAAVRYPRGNGLGVQVHSQLTAMEIGKAEVLALLNEQHEDCISVLAFGSRVQPALEAAQAFAARHEAAVRVVNMRYVKPLDEQLLDDIADSTALFVTVEEHAVMGGAGSAVNEYLAKAQIVKPVCNLGLDDTFMQQAAHSQMLRQAGLDAQGIEKSIEQAWLKVMHTAP